MERRGRCLILGMLAIAHFFVRADISSNFGKTHFVLGATEQEVRESVAQVQQCTNIVPLSTGSDELVHVYFSPDDDIRSLLLDLIAHEKSYIFMAAYMITDKVIAQALIDAHRRKVRVEIVTDSCCAKSDSGKIAMMHEAGIPVYVYTGVPHKPTTSNIMHNKFIVFGNTIKNRSLVWTGSFNFTHSAQRYNQENVILVAQKKAIEQFVDRFNLLKKRCNGPCLTKAHVRSPHQKTAVARNKHKKIKHLS